MCMKEDNPGPKDS